MRGYRESFGRWSDINVILIIDASRMHKTGHLAFVLVQFIIIVVHGGFGLFRYHVSIQVLPESGYSLTTEHAKDISLLLCELWGGFSAERGEIVLQKVRHAG